MSFYYSNKNKGAISLIWALIIFIIVLSISVLISNKSTKEPIKVYDNLPNNQIQDNLPEEPDSSLTILQKKIIIPNNCKMIAAGNEHTCALLNDGSVKCWGNNDLGQLGDGTTINKDIPTPVSGINKVIKISAGSEHSCALSKQFISNIDVVHCWGNNAFGQLGNGTTTDSYTPVRVHNLTNSPFIIVIDIAGGGNHTCALLYDTIAKVSIVKCWGNNAFGQLGNGTTTDSYTPITLDDLGTAIRLTAGGEHTCALLVDAFNLTTFINCWGNNWYGQLGNGTTTDSYVPITVPNLNNAANVVAGNAHTCALLKDGTVKCWGYNGFGQLGNGTTTDSYLPVSVSGISDATNIAAGNDHTCALLQDGTIKCWGLNSSGQLGDGTTTDRYLPVTVTEVSNAINIAAGNDYTCALLKDGAVKCWGYNWHGQAGR